MVKIPRVVLDNVIYLYEDVEAARHGLDFGGTGFLISMKSVRYPDKVAHTYAVSNWHVVKRGRASVVRLMRKDGGARIIAATPSQWIYDEGLGYDLALLPVDIDIDTDKVIFVDADTTFVTKEVIERTQLGPGEDVFMVGRFVDHDGGPVNRPAVRFGNISVMPTPLMQPTGKLADTYCIDMHSRSGYSGSPVWVYRTPGYDLEQTLGSGQNMRLLIAGNNLLALLGIHYDQFPEAWPILSTTEMAKAVERDGPVIKGLSGMTKVLPAWAITELLNIPALVAAREKGEDIIVKDMRLESSGEVASAHKARKVESEAEL